MIKLEMKNLKSDTGPRRKQTKAVEEHGKQFL